MTEEVIVFIKEYMPDIIGAGFGTGLVLSCISCMSGYAIGMLQSFFDNR